MQKILSAISRLAVAPCLIAMLAGAGAAPLRPSPEDRYIATRDAAIAKFSKIYQAGTSDDATRKAEDAVLADLLVQMKAIVAEPDRKGFGPAKLNIDTFSSGDEGFGTLDGLRFDAELGQNGEKAGTKAADGTYIQPKAHIIVTTQTMFERWLRAHKEWWNKGARNVPQQIGAALRDESFYTQAISSGAAVVSFGALPIARPASAASAYALLAGQTQDAVPDAADQVFVSALANGKLYVGYGSIKPHVQVKACLPLHKKTEAAFKRCFARQAPQQPSYQEATRQAEALLAAAMAR